MTAAAQRLQVLPGRYAVCRLPPKSPAPAWARGRFVSVTATEDEVSVICLADGVPPEVKADRDWRAFKVAGPFPFSTVGVLASLATPLAEAGISLLAIGTYDTDYLLVKAESLAAATAALRAAGHGVIEV